MTSSDRTERDRLVARLLGPEGPELTCEQCFDELDRYVELELAGAPADEQVPGMRAHLEGCPACDEDHQSLLAFLPPKKRASHRPAAHDRD
jgi:hypothetical protein